jgi:hypothetical protein
MVIQGRGWGVGIGDYKSDDDNRREFANAKSNPRSMNRCNQSHARIADPELDNDDYQCESMLKMETLVGWQYPVDWGRKNPNLS